MALQKSIAYPTGVIASYWRIIRINILIDGQAEILLAGYVSKEIRDLNPEAYVDAKSFLFYLNRTTLIEGNVFSAVYDEIIKPETTIYPEFVRSNITEGNPFTEAERL